MDTTKEIKNVLAKILSPTATEARECATHGRYESGSYFLGGMVRRSPCPGCINDAAAAEYAAEQRELERARTRKRAEALMGTAAIPKRFHDRTLESFLAETEGQRRAKATAARYAEAWEQNVARGRSIIFCGNPGTGKTHLSIGIAKKVLEGGGSALYTNLLDMVRVIRESYSRDSARTERETIAEFARPDVLILDEVGRQDATDHERQLTFDVINFRYLECRPTIILTNRSMAGLRQYFDESILSRLREGGSVAVEFDWESQRHKY